MVYLGLGLVIVCIIVLDLTKVIDLAKISGFLCSGILFPHMVLLLAAVRLYPGRDLPLAGFVALAAVATIGFLYYFWRLHIVPFRNSKCPNHRITSVYGGRSLILLGFWGLFFQVIFYVILWKDMSYWREDSTLRIIFWVDAAVCVVTLLGFLANGVIRVLCSSRQLGILRRILILMFFWAPVINFWILPYLCKVAKEEYDYACCRFETRMERAPSKVCETKYPIVMVHGVGFRDMRWFNYWGRIPRELVENGATIYYGHQEGWAVMEDNAAIIKEKIEAILEETKCEKVNIIAHSKGGLDSRYCISALGMADKVASLTTICTPHRGSKMVPFLQKLPKWLFGFVCLCIDDMFRLYGDKRPDTYHTALQLSPEFCKGFNEKCKDAPQVYYQSFTSVMRRGYGNSLLGIPYLVMKKLSGPNNDGLVEEESAKWGHYKGAFCPGGWRGVSHGDMIDLHRKDYKGFDVIEVYVEIVKELKAMGF